MFGHKICRKEIINDTSRVRYHGQIQREKVDSIHLAEDWFQLPDSVKKIPAVLQNQIIMS